MTFCYAPWTNLEVLSNGDILPCCKFQHQHYKDQYNITTHSIDDFRNSTMLKQVQQDFKNHQWPVGCERCKIEEANDIPSKRQLDYQRWETYYNQYELESNQLLTLSMAFGNTCNLKCIMCSPFASSRWRQEYIDIYGSAPDSIEGVRRAVVDNITDIAPGLVHLDVHGGEPFLSGVEQHQSLLDHYIKIGRSKEITLHYTTNGTIFPDNSWWERWQHYKSIDLQLSIDGVGKRYEYIRYPADWKELERNVVQYQHKTLTSSNFSISIAHTVSAYNILYLDEFFAWCEQQHLPTPWLGKLHWPQHLRPTVWTDKAKSYIIDQLKASNRSEVQKWAKLIDSIDDSSSFENMLQYTKKHDQYRGVSFTEVFPELANFL